jgi:hypothetical protein
VKKKWWLLLLVILPGGLALAIVGFAIDLYLSLQTGNADADALLLPTIWGLLSKNLPLTPAQVDDTLAQGRALQLVLLAENSFGATSPWPGPVGDQDPNVAPNGPSISPWQIEMSNAIACGYWTAPTDGTDARTAYSQIDTLGNIYEWAGNAADFMQKQVWPHANGDVHLALEVWNGGPNGANKAQSQTYASNAISGTSPAAPGGAPSNWGIS